MEEKILSVLLADSQDNSLGANHANWPSHFCSFAELGTLLGIDPRKVSPFAEILMTLPHLLDPSVNQGCCRFV